MNEEPGFVAGALRDLAASTAAILAAWGALGGATNALTTRMRLRDALRHCAHRDQEISAQPRLFLVPVNRCGQLALRFFAQHHRLVHAFNVSTSPGAHRKPR